MNYPPTRNKKSTGDLKGFKLAFQILKLLDHEELTLLEISDKTGASYTACSGIIRVALEAEVVAITGWGEASRGPKPYKYGRKPSKSSPII